LVPFSSGCGKKVIRVTLGDCGRWGNQESSPERDGSVSRGGWGEGGRRDSTQDGERTMGGRGGGLTKMKQTLSSGWWGNEERAKIGQRECLQRGGNLSAVERNAFKGEEGLGKVRVCQKGRKDDWGRGGGKEYMNDPDVYTIKEGQFLKT